MLRNLIINMKYTNRKIKIRLHPKDMKYFYKKIHELFNELKDQNLSLENNLTSEQVIEDTYCVLFRI